MKMEYLRNDWQIRIGMWMAWTGVIVLLIWVLAKTFGLINTPALLERIPTYATIFAASGLLVSLGKFLQRFESMSQDVRDLKKNAAKQNSDMIKVKSEIKHNTEEILQVRAKVF